MINSSVTKTTGLPDIHVRAVIGNRRLALLGHARRLPEGAPAHDALQVFVELLAGTTSVPIAEESQEDHEAAGYVVFSRKYSSVTAQEAWAATDNREGCTAQRSFADYAF